MNHTEIPQVPLAPTQQEILKTLLDAMPDIIFAKDLDSRFVLANTALARLMGVSSVAELKGKTDSDLMPPQLVAHYAEDDRRIFQTGEPLVNREELNLGVDGKDRWGSTTKIPIRDSNGIICGLVGITRDITEKKRALEQLAKTNAELQSTNEQLKAAQFQLIQFEKAQSLSRLAAGLAHEIKNPLAILEMGLSFIAEEISDETGKAALESMHDAIRRANHVVTDVMHLADTQKLELHPHDINEILMEVLAKTGTEMNAAQISLTTTREALLPPVLVDRFQLEQVILHLLTNARQAMHGGGTLSVRTALRTLTQEESARDSGNRSGIRFRAGEQIAEIEITDTGPGIPEANLSAVFDPFFTTKPTGVAVGLGLTVSRKIMELHGGSISVENAENRGARVTLRIKI
ncbi:MAG: PAS domain-containing protein [Verrucomicrobiota bacterium]